MGLNCDNVSFIYFPFVAGISRGCHDTTYNKAVCENKMGTSSNIGSTCYCTTDRCNASGIPSLNALAKITTFTITVIMFLSISTF